MPRMNRLAREESKRMNTELHYTYVDASGYKQDKTVIIAGEVTPAQVEPYLAEGLYFIPSQVGLEDLQEGFLAYGPLGEDDHVWHTIEEGDITLTAQEPTMTITAGELLQAFAQGTWDVSTACEAHGI
jgi:hypothetical protein